MGDIKKHGITARAQEIDGEFVVMKGSMTRREAGDGSYRKLFDDLVRAGLLAPSADGNHNVFTMDYAFTSPSAAAAVVTGRNTNGRAHWIVEGSTKSYGQWQDEQVTKAAAQVGLSAMLAANAIAAEGV